MFRDSLHRKVFGIFAAFLMAFDGFTGEAGDARPDAPDKDPLLPFIDPASRVSMGQFRELIGALSPERREDLWKAIEGKAHENDVTPGELEERLRGVSSSLFNKFRSSKELDYHETVKWTAGKLGVDPAECEAGTTFQLEKRVREKFLAKKWDGLTPEQRSEALQNSGHGPPSVIGNSSNSRGSAVTALMFGATVAAGATLGATVGSTIGKISPFLGGGAGAAAAAALAGGVLLMQPDVEKTAAFIIKLHSIKEAALARSGVDAAKYHYE